MQKIKFLLKYLKYRLTAKHAKGFGIHSPFLYELINDVIYDFTTYYAQDDIWELRQELLSDKRIIEVTDFGAGSHVMKSNKRKIKDIAKHSAVNEKFGELLFRLVVKFRPKTILEIGTSIGLGTLYLAMPDSRNVVYSLEGCPETAKIAKENFDILEVKNIKQIIGNFDKTLPKLLNETNNLDFVYFDGNHTKEATIKYFEMCLPKINNNTIFVFDDIHWSPGMSQAWNYIKQSQKVKLTVDLFFSGIVFFKKELSKQDFVVKF